MRDVNVIGIHAIPVSEYWDKSLRHLAHDAIMGALKDAGVDRVDALVVGNTLASFLAEQGHLGALIADFVGLRGVEAVRVDAADASGAAAFRWGYMAVAGGLADVVVVIGVEQMSERSAEEVHRAHASVLDQEFEGIHGATPNSIQAMLMRRYMHEFHVAREDFAAFPLTAHANAVGNPNAMFRRAISEKAYARAGLVADPLNMFDVSPISDGAAAVVLCPADRVRALAKTDKAPVRVLASAVATDAVAVHDRKDPLFLQAAYLASHAAYTQAGITPRDVDLFELHDSTSIMAALSLEACGFVARGQAVHFAREGGIARDGLIPVSTMGGLKARGNPLGATGVYQIVELVQQLRGEAGDCQVQHARIGMAQNLGGTGATAITHILRIEE